jgi:hypothetical protein
VIGVKIHDSVSGTNVKVSPRGELAVSALDFSTFYSASVTVNDTAVNVITPKAQKVFIITAIIVAADRSVAAAGSVLSIYTADDSTTGAVIDVIYSDELSKQTRAVVSPINIIVPEGKFVNIVADDVIIRCNIAGYYTSA